MPGTTIAIDCLRPMVLRIVSAAAMAAGDGVAGAVVVAAGAAGAAGGVVSAALRRHAQGCEHEESETALGDSGAGGHQ